MNTKSLTLITLSFATLNCINSTGQSTDTALENEKTAPKEQVGFSKERIAFLKDSLSGIMPLSEITPYINSLQGKPTPAWKIPEIWKLKETEAIATLYDWNEKHNNHTADHNNLFYSDNLDFYGEEKKAPEISDIKAKMFERYPDFHQEIIPSSIVTYDDGDGSINRIEFTKKVTMNGKVTTYNSFLEFAGTRGAFFI